MTGTDYTALSFYYRYLSLCMKTNVNPCGMDVMKNLGINKATVSTWKSAGTTPKGETVRKIADLFHTSTDFLLGRTNDETDYTAVNHQTHIPERLSRKISSWDNIGTLLVESYVDGLLSRGGLDGADQP